MMIQVNQLLTNEEAELGLTSISEDIDAEDDDGPVISIINRSTCAIIRSLSTTVDSPSSNLSF